MRSYKVLLPLTVHTEKESFTQGQVFEQVFSEDDEAQNVASGLLELQPSRYRVLVDSQVFGVSSLDSDPTFEAALLMGQERLLVEGGHIERMRASPKKPVEVPKTTKKKESN